MSTKQFTIETPCERLLKSLGWMALNKSLNVASIPHADALSPERDCRTLQPWGGSTRPHGLDFTFLHQWDCLSPTAASKTGTVSDKRIRDSRYRLFSKFLTTVFHTSRIKILSRTYSGGCSFPFCVIGG